MSTVATVLAAYNPDDIKPGWIALLIVLALAVGTYLLWRNMNTQLRRIDVPTKAELAEQESAGSSNGESAAPTGDDAEQPEDTADNGSDTRG